MYYTYSWSLGQLNVEPYGFKSFLAFSVVKFITFSPLTFNDYKANCYLQIGIFDFCPGREWNPNSQRLETKV